jgi:signal transduction histidine kinase
VKLGWGARQALVLLVLAVALVLTSFFLELTNVVRLALDGARTESGVITQALQRQIEHVAAGKPEDVLGAVREDARIALILEAAMAQAPSVVSVALCDSGGVAIAHSVPGRIGERLPSRRALPVARSLWGAMRLLAESSGSREAYEVQTPLLLGAAPLGSIRVGVASVFLRERVGEVLRRSMVVGAIELTLAVVLGYAMAGVQSRRLRQLGARVAAMREGHFGGAPLDSGVDEFSRLARDLNLLSEQFQKERQERDSSLGSFQRAVELLGEGVLTLGPGREVVLINGPTGRILRVDPVDARGKRIEDLLPEGHHVRRLVERLLAGSEGSLSIRLPREGSGPGYVAVGHRITETDGPGGVLVEFRETGALEDLHAMVDQSRVLSRLGQMATGVAHEIRNSLQTISFELGILRESRGGDPDEIAAHVREASAEIQKLQRSVSGFLKVARLRQLAPAPIHLNDLLLEVHRAMEAEANLAGLELELDSEQGLPETHADREVLRQALQNVVRNAIQALPSRDGRILLRSRAVGGEILISVHDTGPGIPAEIREKVSDLYFTTKEGGTGVGLAIVRQAVEMHGGELDIDSGPGEGAAVTLRLPLRAATHAAR